MSYLTTSTGIRIGSACIPVAKVTMYRDDVLIQSALLAAPRKTFFNFLRRFL